MLSPSHVVSTHRPSALPLGAERFRSGPVASNTTREHSHSSYSSVNSFYHTSGGLGSDDSEPLEGAVKDDDEGHDGDSVSFTSSIPRFTSFFNVSSLIASWLMIMIFVTQLS